MRRTRSNTALNRNDSGFSIIELVVTLAIVVIVIVAMSTLFDRSARISKVETSVTETQQSARYGSYQIVREARMAGAGGYPASIADGGNFRQLAVSLNLGSSHWGTSTNFDSNNINGTSDVVCIGAACANPGAHHIRAGTDILHIRGVLLNSVYDLGSGGWTPPAGGGATTGTLVIQPCTKYTDPAAPATPSSTFPCAPNGANDMSLFPTAAGSPKPSVGRLFVITDLLGNVGVGKITDAVAVTVTTSGAFTGTRATLTIDVGNSGTPESAYWQTLSPNGIFPSGLTTPSRGGVLDDRVFFIDDGPDKAQDCNPTNAALSPGPCHPQLAVADWADGDTAAAPFSTATVTPIADDVEDLQVAYGVDFYDLVTGTPATLAAPAPVRTDPSTGALLNYPSDGSISITNQTNFNTYVTSARGATIPAAGTDTSESTTAGGDEWIWNVAGEPTSGTFIRTSDLSRLKAIELTVLAKGANPDPQYKGPNAQSWSLMDSISQSVSQITKDAPGGTALARAYHRRAVSVRAQLRNFGIQ
jgi:prepilin-type N-terminal cleavage/methylation domain-containing protein